MDIPEPSNVPIKRVRDYLWALRAAIMGSRPQAGHGVKTNEYPGKGTVISIDDLQTLDLSVCVDGVQKTVTFYVSNGPH